MSPREKLESLLKRLRELGEQEELSETEVKELEAGPARVKALKAEIEAQEVLDTEAEAEEQAAAEATRQQIEDAAASKASELLAVRDAELREQLGVGEDDDLDEALQQLAEKANKRRQPQAPPGSGGEDENSPRISVGSEFDRISTFDLALRYETMKVFGQQPSRRFLGALEDRAHKMSREEDTLYIKNGEPVKAAAIDWDYLAPRRLTSQELREDRGPGADKASDPISQRGYDQFEKVTKADELVYSTQASGGDEWVPTLMNAQLWRTVRLNAAVLAQLEQFDMPSQPYDYPTESTDPVIYKVAESTNESQLVIDAGPFTDSKPGTAKITFSAGKMGAISYWSEEQEEDGIIAFEPQVRDQYGLSIAHGIDEILLSGDETTDTTNISNEGTSLAASSRFLVLDGLRHEPLITTTADSRDGTALTIDDFGATVALMGSAGVFGLNPNDLVWLMDGGVWHKARLLGEVLTVDKFGPMATVFNGQLASLFGSPIIVSEDYSLTDATGNIDDTASDNIKGSFMAINKRGVKVGWRRRPRVRVERLPFADAAYIVGSARFDIGFKEAGMVAMSYNITV